MVLSWADEWLLASGCLADSVRAQDALGAERALELCADMLLRLSENLEELK